VEIEKGAEEYQRCWSTSAKRKKCGMGGRRGIDDIYASRGACAQLGCNPGVLRNVFN